MSHPWEELVIGGVGQPRILTIDSNFCNNPYFDEDTTGWSGSGGFSREENEDAFSQYMGKLVGSQYIYFSKNTGEAITDKIFMARVRVKGDDDQDIQISLVGSSQYITKSYSIDSGITYMTIVGTAAGETGNNIAVRIDGDPGGLNTLYFDSVYLTEVTADYTFNQPQESYMRFEDVIGGENELEDGKIQRFDRRYRPYYYAMFEYLSADMELYRQLVHESVSLFVIPHNDIDWGFLAIWNGDFERRYSFGRFFGHYGIMPMKGNELLTNKPIIQAGTGGITIDELEVLIT